MSSSRALLLMSVALVVFLGWTAHRASAPVRVGQDERTGPARVVVPDGSSSSQAAFFAPPRPEPAPEAVKPKLKHIAWVNQRSAAGDRVFEVIDGAGIDGCLVAGIGPGGLMVEEGSVARATELLRQLMAREKLDIKLVEDYPQGPDAPPR